MQKTKQQTPKAKNQNNNANTNHNKILIVLAFSECFPETSPHTHMCIRLTSIVLAISKWISINAIHVHQILVGDPCKLEQCNLAP